MRDMALKCCWTILRNDCSAPVCESAYLMAYDGHVMMCAYIEMLSTARRGRRITHSTTLLLNFPPASCAPKAHGDQPYFLGVSSVSLAYPGQAEARLTEIALPTQASIHQRMILPSGLWVVLVMSRALSSASCSPAPSRAASGTATRSPCPRAMEGCCVRHMQYSAPAVVVTPL